MKFTLAGAASALALASGAAFAADDAYDLWQSTEAGQSLIAVTGAAEGAPFAVAAGETAEALDILPADMASLAIADLKARTETAEIEAETDIAENGDAVQDIEIAEATPVAEEAAAGDAKVHKIVLAKKVVDTEAQEAPQSRRIIKLKTDESIENADIEALIESARADLAGDAGAEIEIEQTMLGADDEDAALFAAAGEAETLILKTEENGAASRLVRISGVDAETVRGFIDAAGLDDEEKAAMKAGLGL